MEKKNWTQALNLTVLIAGLGYFVDMFDIAIFGVVRVASLNAIGVTDPGEVLTAGIKIYNAGMIGMMLGGLIWGIMADKKGRLSVLFGSILLYSVGNILNAFVTDVNTYAICRFITGVGLAGELGAAITLVSESLPKEYRGIGTTIVATLGLCGSICASYVGQILDWKTAYVVGGVMGLGLLAARVHMRESIMLAHVSAPKGDLRLFLKGERFLRYILCIFLGVPIYFITGILFTFSPEITAGLQVDGVVTAGNAILYGSIGLAIGDLLSGLLSQFFRSRKKALVICLLLALSQVLIYLLKSGLSASNIYVLCFVLGLAGGYWAVLVTVAAEQFGTNIRGTVATTVPNFVRGSAVLCVTGFSFLKHHVSVGYAALIVGGICFTLAFIAVAMLRETFGENLDYVEE